MVLGFYFGDIVSRVIVFADSLTATDLCGV